MCIWNGPNVQLDTFHEASATIRLMYEIHQDLRLRHVVRASVPNYRESKRSGGGYNKDLIVRTSPQEQHGLAAQS